MIKLYMFMAVCMFSHRIETSVLDSMHTSSLTSALHQIMQNHGWKTFQLSFDPDLSLNPAATAAVTELMRLEETDEEADDENKETADTKDPAMAAEVVQNLRDGGFQLRIPPAKLSWRQSNVESSIQTFK